ncbi:MAG: SpoIIE family protein phosphatase, partial [Chloroflexota bacterium]
LPHELPALDGWRVAAYYQPARAVGGDFYDFIYLPDGRIAFVIGDVTDKGVPAALVMATTRATLRAAAQGLVSPGEVLERVNESLCPEIPPNMFVTCFYAVLDPASGRLQYANAGHDVPYRCVGGVASELRARGMPLGLMPGMSYEEKETTIAHGERILFHSDGLVEAHNAKREMFSFPKLQQLMADYATDADLIQSLRGALASFTGDGWEQEDDVTLMTLERKAEDGRMKDESENPKSRASVPNPKSQVPSPNIDIHPSSLIPHPSESWRTLAEFSIASATGNERMAMQQVAESIQSLALPAARIERLKTAVSEATMNAIEHGNHNNPDLPVAIRVRANGAALSVTITDKGGGALIPLKEEPNLEAKLAGLQSPRGWGLFLIKNLVDEMNVTSDEQHHTIELIMRLEGGL